MEVFFIKVKFPYKRVTSTVVCRASPGSVVSQNNQLRIILMPERYTFVWHILVPFTSKIKHEAIFWGHGSNINYKAWNICSVWSRAICEREKKEKQSLGYFSTFPFFLSCSLILQEINTLPILYVIHRKESCRTNVMT